MTAYCNAGKFTLLDYNLCCRYNQALIVSEIRFLRIYFARGGAVPGDDDVADRSGSEVSATRGMNLT